MNFLPPHIQHVFLYLFVGFTGAPKTSLANTKKFNINKIWKKGLFLVKHKDLPSFHWEEFAGTKTPHTINRMFAALHMYTYEFQLS